MQPNSHGDRMEMGIVVLNDSKLRSVSFLCRLIRGSLSLLHTISILP